MPEDESGYETFTRLQAQNERLLLGAIEAQLNLCCTIATFADGFRCDSWREACQCAALKGYEAIQRKLSTLRVTVPASILARVDQLCTALAGSQSVDRRQQHAHPEKTPVTSSAGDIQATETGYGQGEALTRREIEVLKAIAEGHSTKDVARMLGITFKTAACHRYRVMDKLGIHETATLVRYAVRRGLVHA